MNDPRSRLRRREIRAADLGGVLDLLGRGFPARPRAYWERGLGRMGERPQVPGCPRYGFLLDDGGRTVGVVLTLFAMGRDGDIRCNLSSWTVDPAYRAQAPLLVASALKREGVTFINTSPAPHTWATIEAQGFLPYADHQSLVLPWLRRARGRGSASEDPAAWRDLPEAPMLDDHARYGCRCLTIEDGDGVQPLVLLPVRARSGRWRLPLMQLVFCRDLRGLEPVAGALGRWMARRGAIGLIVDGAPPAGLAGIGRVRRTRKYVRGPHPQRLGDLTYTELPIFGP